MAKIVVCFFNGTCVAVCGCSANCDCKGFDAIFPTPVVKPVTGVQIGKFSKDPNWIGGETHYKKRVLAKQHRQTIRRGELRA